MKEALKGRRIMSDAQVKQAVRNFFQQQTSKHFERGIQALVSQ